MIVVASSSAGSSLMLASGMAESTSMGVVMRFGLRRTLRMEAMAALLVLMVGGLRIEVEAQRGIEVEVLKNLTWSCFANFTLVAMCSMAVMGMGSKRLASKWAVFTFFLEILPAFGLFGAEALGCLEVVLAMISSLPWFGRYWRLGLGREPS